MNTENTELTKKQETGLVSASEYKWSQEEIEGSIGVSRGGYNKEYKYFLKASPASKQFQLIDNETDEVLATMDKINCVIYHGHAAYKLLVGHLEGHTGDHRKWAEGNPDENKRLTKLAAISYDSPFAPKGASRGNFDRGGHGEWLDSESKRDILEKRQFVILLIPELIANGKIQKRPILASFGGSSIMPFVDYFKSVNLTGQPPFMLRSTISFVSDTKKGSNDTYNKVVFDFEKNEKGEAYMNMMFSGNDEESDPRTGPWGKRLRKRIEQLHSDYVVAAENGEMSMSGAGNSNSAIDVTPEQSQSTPMQGLDEPFNDDIPF